MSTRHEIRIDRTKTLTQQPGTGHNRWHPDIPPVILLRHDRDLGHEGRGRPLRGCQPRGPQRAPQHG